MDLRKKIVGFRNHGMSYNWISEILHISKLWTVLKKTWKDTPTSKKNIKNWLSFARERLSWYNIVI